MSDPIRTELANGVLTVTLARAEKKNAITQAMYSTLAEATERARQRRPCGAGAGVQGRGRQLLGRQRHR
jgi:enoyl-CoA hydratase/carnithine racemase